MTEPAISRRIFLLVYAALLVLTLATTGVAFIDLGPFSTVVAVVIAGMKATLIVLFFMEMIHSPMLARVVAIGALVWFGILISLTMGDYLTRGWVPVPGK